jgi:predicted transcriptional regulator
MFISDKRAFLSALGLNKATKDKKAAELKRGKHTRKNLKDKKSELTTKTAGKKSDVEKVTNKKSHIEKVTNKKSHVDQIKHEVEEAIKSKIEK